MAGTQTPNRFDQVKPGGLGCMGDRQEEKKTDISKMEVVVTLLHEWLLKDSAY